MFKRANKITSLLVTAAAVMSLVPAYAADVKKVDSEDGTVYNAIAYADGKAFIDGEINDKEADYYLAKGKLTELADVDSGDDAVAFGDKYLNVSDGDYTVNLDSGTVTDDDIVGDTADDAAAALRKEIKDDTDDRYDENTADNIKEENELTVIPGAKFGKVWYSTTYDAKIGQTDANNSATSFNVYTDTDGKYIDADYNLGKVKVTTTTGSVTSTETIENTNDTYDAANVSGSTANNDKLRASVKEEKVLTQDKDYIYRLATVTVSTTGSSASIKEINGVAVSTAAFTVTDANKTVTFKAIQKISKAQSSDDVDGANYAKTVTTYVLSNDDGTKLSNEDLFVDANGAVVTTTNYTIADGKLIAYATTGTDKVEANAYTLKTSGGFYYADEEDSSSEDVEYNSDDSVYAVQTDVDGNLWRLDGGYIYKFDNTDDWNKVYKVDGSLDKLSVYDENNIVAWSEDDEVYSVIGGKNTTKETTATTTTTTTATTTAAAGWVQAADKTWSYNTTTGTKATSWLQLGSTWYYLNANGVMVTGWQEVGGTWYFLTQSGAMATGWFTDATGTYYYANGSGAMLSNTVVDGYKLGASGAWVK